jgi:L-alanine-DL-glutamate epimerase-like enolase superfamily enzyme
MEGTMHKKAEVVNRQTQELLKIEEVRTWRTILRRSVPWKTARYTKGDIEATIVGITDEDGVVGYGYVPAMFLEGESAPSAEALLYVVLKPTIKRQDLAGIQPLMKEMDLALAHNHQLKFAVEMALLDLQAKKLRTPLYNLLGGLCYPEVPVMRMVGLKPPKETAEEARSLVERGFTYIKLKIGLDEKRDVESMRAVRETVGDEIFISVDANRSYTAMQAVKVINKMEEWNLGVVEQPVRADDIRGMAFVRQHIRTPLMADEGVLTSADALRLIEAGAIDAVSIKLWKVGGFHKAKEIASVCNAANVSCHVASTPGSQLMEAGQLHFAASTLNMMGGAEIGEFEGLLDDPASGLVVTKGCLQIPKVPGLGVEVDLRNARETTLTFKEGSK